MMQLNQLFMLPHTETMTLKRWNDRSTAAHLCRRFVTRSTPCLWKAHWVTSSQNALLLGCENLSPRAQAPCELPLWLPWEHLPFFGTRHRHE